MTEPVEILRQVDLFSHLGDEQLALLAAQSREQRFDRQALLMHEGERGETMCVVVDGEVRVFVSDENGRELVLHQLGPGAVIGDLALLDGAPRSASVVAAEPTRVLTIARDGLIACVRESPEFALAIMRSLTTRLRQATEGSRSLALDNVYRRLADKLRELAGIDAEHGPAGARDDPAGPGAAPSGAPPSDAAPTLPRRYSHQELGNLIGASREMVGKVMAELVKGDYVALVDGRIRLLKRLPKNW